MRKKLTIAYIKDSLSPRFISYEDDVYQNCDEKHNFKCLKCSFDWRTNVRHVLYDKSGCSKCNPRTKLKYNNIFDIKKELEVRNILYADDYYNNVSERHNYICLICKEPWSNTIHCLRNSKTGCPKCGKSLKLKLVEIKKQLIERKILFKDKKYINAKFKHKFQCLQCFHMWKTTIDSVLNRKSGCPACVNVHNSKSEYLFHKIINFIYPLTNRNYKFFQKRNFRFDNFINNVAIEFDGRVWHEKEVSKIRDNEKNYLCLKNNIAMIRFDHELWKIKKLKYKAIGLVFHFIEQFTSNLMPKCVILIRYEPKTKDRIEVIFKDLNDFNKI